ncbi:MAG: AAA family ATPase [Acidobacteria bacterium]|nr:AAA family ATPase [Acidobacteriota bacterium]
MLVCLKVKGFKNLVDTEIRFGPFTCIAGPNGVGKSNLFDAITFLSALADKPLVEAAVSVRDEGSKTGDIRSLFHRVGVHYDDEVSFVADMIVPRKGIDDWGREAAARSTLLQYSLSLAYRRDEGAGALGSLEVRREELRHLNISDAGKHLLFLQEPADLWRKSASWRKSAVFGKAGRGAPFISTDGQSKTVKVHQDGESGRPRSFPAPGLLRTALSGTNSAETPTALLAKREMQSWRLLQLEPSELRRSDGFTAPTKIGIDGSHLAATLHYLARASARGLKDAARLQEAEGRVYGRVANRLSELIDDVHSVQIDRDERRELLTLLVTGRDGTSHPARALSDGTLRFLALAVLELDSESSGLLCLEEPENGIHPERIPAMLSLLQDIATDTDEEIGPENPLRQVIINTHSPTAAAQVPDDSLLFANLSETVAGGARFKQVVFSCLKDTWRQKGNGVRTVDRGTVLNYLNPLPISPPEVPSYERTEPADAGYAGKEKPWRRRRVVDRSELQLPLQFGENP